MQLFSKKILLIGIITILPFIAISQKNKVNPNGYNIFYYPNGKISSEGYMKNGKPDGFWKTYYPNGILKSEGNRKNTLLDSTWIFFNEKGDTLEIINYRNGKKNGYNIKYNYEYDDSGHLAKKELVSKELFLNDKKEGKAYYYKNNKLHLIVNYKNGIKNGFAFEISNDTLITTLYEYKNGFLVFSEKINRFDKDGKKHGVWKEFYPDGKLKREMYYIHGQLNGLYKEYSPDGKLTTVLMYKYGQPEKVNKNSVRQITQKQTFYKSGKLKHSGYYKHDTIPVGVHKEYDEAGNVTLVKIYDDEGHLKGKGMFDKHGRKTGIWKEFFTTGELKAEGKYKKGKRSGLWKFYYENGALEQKGYYYKGKPHKIWKYYDPNGNLIKYESYYKGRNDGPYYLFSNNGDTLVKGYFTDGERDSTWKFVYQDKIETGTYKEGLKEGKWTRKLLANGKVIYKAEFIQGVPHGKVYYYFNNGKLRRIEEYKMGIPHGIWQYYTPNGEITLIEKYRNGKLIKINGKRFKWPKKLKNPNVILDDHKNKKKKSKTLTTINDN
jgi:antitoxin component YwqK of YwqJK toxin-antitoxin module